MVFFNQTVPSSDTPPPIGKRGARARIGKFRLRSRLQYRNIKNMTESATLVSSSALLKLERKKHNIYLFKCAGTPVLCGAAENGFWVPAWQKQSFIENAINPQKENLFFEKISDRSERHFGLGKTSMFNQMNYALITVVCGIGFVFSRRKKVTCQCR